VLTEKGLASSLNAAVAVSAVRDEARAASANRFGTAHVRVE
jgi:hypothetical protein